jgi:hypothetical protein
MEKLSNLVKYFENHPKKQSDYQFHAIELLKQNIPLAKTPSFPESYIKIIRKTNHNKIMSIPEAYFCILCRKQVPLGIQTPRHATFLTTLGKRIENWLYLKIS